MAARQGPGSGGRGGFTLIEILIVVVVLGILAAVTVPQFSNAAQESSQVSTSKQLQTLRAQIEVYRNQQGVDPDLINNQWDDLIASDYLVNAPRNLRNGSTVVAGAPGAGVGWVWRDKGNGTLALYATDETFAAEVPE